MLLIRDWLFTGDDRTWPLISWSMRRGGGITVAGQLNEITRE